MTSNLGSHLFREAEKPERIRSLVLETLRQSLRPEFLNRIDEIVIFKPLGREEIEAIVKIQVGHLVKRLADKRITLELTPAAEELLAREGYDPVYGARPDRVPQDGRGARGLAAFWRSPRVRAAVLLHVVVSGLATGSIYALVALSLVIIYNATRTVNFAQGEMLMVSAFVAWSANQGLGLPLPVALGCAVGAGALLGLLVERAIIRRAISATHWDVLIITLGLSLVLRSGA